MPLEINHVGGLAVGTAPEEVVVAHFVQCRQRGEGRDVTTDIGGLVGLGDHRHGVPADVSPDQSLHLEVARIFGFLLGRDRIEVGRRGDVRNRVALIAQPLHHAGDQLACLLGGLALQNQSQQILHRGAMPVGCGQGTTRGGTFGAPVDRGGRTMVGTRGIQDSIAGAEAPEAVRYSIGHHCQVQG